MELCVFSKHLQELEFEELGATLKELGVDGVDLTVRPGGNVEPEAVRDKLPEAKEILASQGIRISMITTAITDINDPHATDVLETAGSLRVGYFKLGYYHYEGFGSIKRQMAEATAKIKDIEPLCRENSIKAGFHNHSGDFIGGSIPHILRIIDTCDPKWVGVYYDIGHAAIEGGYAGWKMNLDEASDRLFMIAAKDLILHRQQGKAAKRSMWRGETVPLGEGLVDWKGFIACLKQIDFAGPFSLHSEYKLPTQEVIEQTRKDLAYLRPLLE